MRYRLLILLLAGCFQVTGLVRDVRFHPDEAYFMTFARNASVNGDWMLSGALDKPPLSIYSSALSMMFIGTTTDANGVLHLDSRIGEFSARLPNVLLAILLVAILMRLTFTVYGDARTAQIAGLLLATSPYLLAFGATAFTDMMLLFWLVVALWMSRSGHGIRAGLALALALWSKQQAVFYLPLIVACIIASRHEEPRPYKVLRFVFSLGIGVICLLLWDNARPETSIFLLGTINNSPDTLLAPVTSIGERLAIWLNLASLLVSEGIITVLVVAISVFVYGRHMRERERCIGWDTLFLSFIFIYSVIHIFTALNQYDRYLLPMLPLVVMLCARGIARFLGHWMASGALVVVMVTLGVMGVSNGYPIGGDGVNYGGIDEVATYLNRKPVATVIYDRWLGWELGYYMGQWTDKRRVYFPTPRELADGAVKLKEIGDRYLVAPKEQALDAWLDALETAGFTVVLDWEHERFVVYRLSPPAWDA